MKKKEQIHKELEDYICSKLSELSEVTDMRVCDVNIDFMRDMSGKITDVILNIKYE